VRSTGATVEGQRSKEGFSADKAVGEVGSDSVGHDKTLA